MSHPTIFKTPTPLQTVEFEIYRARLAQFGQWRRVDEWGIGEEFERSCLVGNVVAWRTSAHHWLWRFFDNTLLCTRWRLLVATDSDGGTTTKDWTNANAQLLLQRTQSYCRCHQLCKIKLFTVCLFWKDFGEIGWSASFNVREFQDTEVLPWHGTANLFKPRSNNNNIDII